MMYENFNNESTYKSLKLSNKQRWDNIKGSAIVIASWPKWKRDVAVKSEKIQIDEYLLESLEEKIKDLLKEVKNQNYSYNMKNDILLLFQIIQNMRIES